MSHVEQAHEPLQWLGLCQDGVHLWIWCVPGKAKTPDWTYICSYSVWVLFHSGHAASSGAWHRDPAGWSISYDIMKISLYTKTASQYVDIIFWNADGAEERPNGTQQKQKRSSWKVNTVMSQLSGSRSIWWYAEERSMVENRVAVAGLFSSLRSTHMRGFPPPVLGATEMGTHGDASMRSMMPLSCRSFSSSVAACLTQNGSVLSFCCTGITCGFCLILCTNPFALPASWTWTRGAVSGVAGTSGPFVLWGLQVESQGGHCSLFLLAFQQQGCVQHVQRQLATQ